MRKHETYQRASQNRDLHGFDGPIKVSFGNYTYPIMQDFLRAAESQGFPVTDDLQDLVTSRPATVPSTGSSGSIETLDAEVMQLQPTFTPPGPSTRICIFSATPKLTGSSSRMVSLLVSLQSQPDPLADTTMFQDAPLRPRSLSLSLAVL